MREILFRGQTRRKGEKVRMDGTPIESNWVYGGVLQGTGDHSIIYQTEPDIDKKVVYTDTLGQYTGLTDKNGTKIFEGDIIQDGNCEYNKYVVEYSPERGGYLPFAHGDGCGCCETATLYDSTCHTVIGNIYDNPELMKE
jgi:uncharacterized phage protein (TIGR01671 family)